MSSWAFQCRLKTSSSLGILQALSSRWKPPRANQHNMYNPCSITNIILNFVRGLKFWIDLVRQAKISKFCFGNGFCVLLCYANCVQSLISYVNLVKIDRCWIMSAHNHLIFETAFPLFTVVLKSLIANVPTSWRRAALTDMNMFKNKSSRVDSRVPQGHLYTSDALSEPKGFPGTNFSMSVDYTSPKCGIKSDQPGILGQSPRQRISSVRDKGEGQDSQPYWQVTLACNPSTWDAETGGL